MVPRIESRALRIEHRGYEFSPGSRSNLLFAIHPPQALHWGHHPAPLEDYPMPWTMADASRHTKKADTKKEQRQWSAVANAVLKKTDNKARAIASANSVIKSRGK